MLSLKEISEKLEGIRDGVANLKDKVVKAEAEKEQLIKRREEIIEELRELGIDDIDKIDETISNEREKLEMELTEIEKQYDEIKELI